MTSVPAFPATRKISMDDKPAFDEYFRKYPPQISELTFANFYIWKDCDRSEITLVNGNICVLARPNNEAPYFFEPLGEQAIDATISICSKYVPRFSRISESFTKKHFEGRQEFKIEIDRDHSDYVYLKGDLAELKGKKYDGKRNKIKKFLKNNASTYKKLASQDIEQCRKLLEKWGRGKNKSNGVCFNEPIEEALSNFEKLGLKGAVIDIGGSVQAFTIGQKLNNDTAIVYIEVANPDIDGISQYINQQFCREWDDCKCINREEDMGDAGLRKAKISYHPFKMINKYSIARVD